VSEIEIKAGKWRGPLHGMPVGIKDFYDTAGIKTTALGSSGLCLCGLGGSHLQHNFSAPMAS
jgi:hypothetical protein